MTKTSHQQGFLRMLYAKQYRHWDSPQAPSKGECKIIKEFIKKKNPRILILGATPRLRDLAHSLRAEVTCVDINLDMILSLCELMKYQKQTKKEIWVRSDWIQMPLAQNYWDYVLGDWVICNLPLKLQPKFLAKINQILKPSGYFITRMSLMFRRYSIKDLEEAMNFYSKGQLTASDVMWVISHLGYNPKNYQNRSSIFLKIAKKVIHKNKKLQKIFKEIAPPPGMQWTATPLKILDPMVKRYFKIIAIKYGPDNHFKEECPIYFLKKK